MNDDIPPPAPGDAADVPTKLDLWLVTQLEQRPEEFLNVVVEFAGPTDPQEMDALQLERFAADRGAGRLDAEAILSLADRDDVVRITGLPDPEPTC